MKKLSIALIALSLSLFTVVGCSKDDNNNNAGNQNITAIVTSNSNFSLLAQAINRAGIANTINTSNNITVFAPDNAAFAASGINEAMINAMSPDTLATILTYHVVGSVVPSGSVPVSDTVRTLQGRNIYASRNANGVFVNGVSVKQADIAASNGTIHVISNVLMPPTRTIAEIAASDPNFSLLLAAVVKANLAQAVSGPGKFTVFAPTNAAFNAAGFATATDINNAPQATIETVVKYHVLPTTVFASDLTNNAVVNSLQGGLTVTLPPARVKISSSSSAASNINATNMVATNGVVHVIDRVLLP